MTISGFNHKISVVVRFHEVDMLGVCNNAVYLNYFETARLEYIKSIGLMPGKGIFSDGKLFFVVHNEIDYLDHARYDDVLDVYSRISFIKNSSFGYDHLVVNQKNNKEIAKGKGVIVYVDPVTGKSTDLPELFVETIKRFEPEVRILKDEKLSE